MGLNGAFTVNDKYTSVSKNFLIITQLKILKIYKCTYQHIHQE